ncbi:hypothetical protein DK427_20115 [Methylobacterium radiodurans]|uniref:Uncharacterized protein n=2 Tax=Methylobacterium radiodurans TaxID=2202828 RepID=A0A2U8VX70_9HYPH|nr:hypothetical protein DK427_20115 [Methylobacterium radiodurans]
MDGASSLDGDEANGIEFPAKAQRTLDQIADALGVATTLLKQGGGAEVPMMGSSASLAEASALLQAFIRIEDPEVRKSLLARARNATKRT